MKKYTLPLSASPASSSPGLIYQENVAIPMRDGVILRANIWRPEREGAFPAVLERTPYGKPAGLDNGAGSRYVNGGYVLIAQDSRGRHASDGTWIPFSEPVTGDAEDGFDTIEWIAAQPWCSGRVGTTGASYNGWLQWQQAGLRPPHLFGMSARTIPLELDELDWTGGCFKAARRLHWWFVSMAPNLRKKLGLPPPHASAQMPPFAAVTETNTPYKVLPLSTLTQFLPPGLAETAKAWMREPGRRPWGFAARHALITVPNFDITGWYDHCHATIGHFTGMRQNGGSAEARKGTRLLIGPWNHVNHGRRKQGPFDFGPAAEVDIGGLLLRWFDCRLRGIDNGLDREPAVRYFVMGVNTWKGSETWPPPGAQPATRFLGSGGTLALQPRGEEDSSDSYTVDPNDPVPSLCEPAMFTMPTDRRRLDQRSDILRYVSEPLERDVEIAGCPEVVLHVASTAPDTDFFARLADDSPNGPALELCYGILRARYRGGLENEQLLVPGETVEIRIKLGPTACRFLKGHRIRLEICGADFPLHDRNHQTGGNDLFESELKVATHTVFHTAALPSRLILPVMDS